MQIVFEQEIYVYVDYIFLTFNTYLQCCGSGPIFTGSGSADPVLKKPDPDPGDPKRPDLTGRLDPDPDPPLMFNFEKKRCLTFFKPY